MGDDQIKGKYQQRMRRVTIRVTLQKDIGQRKASNTPSL